MSPTGDPTGSGCWASRSSCPRRVTCITRVSKSFPVTSTAKQDTADWLGGQEAGVAHAKRGWQLRLAAGGSYGAPIYASIDDDPTPEQYKQQVAPYLRGGEAVLGHQRVGVYGNSKTIDWALQDGLGGWFWQHNRGSPTGFPPPGRTSPSGGDRQAFRGGRRGGHEQHHEAEFRTVGLKAGLIPVQCGRHQPPAARFQQTFFDNSEGAVTSDSLTGVI